jgi:radical SAM protein with 4Fe4S-binding SPASM domain
MNVQQGKKIPGWIVLQLLENCNLRCKMCYQWGETGVYNGLKPRTLETSVVERIVDECMPGVPYYGLFGGEPLMHPDLEKVISKIKSAGSNLYIDTNGTLLEKKAEFLVGMEVNRIWISLDGTEEMNDLQRGKGVFRKVIAGIDKLNEGKKKNKKNFPRVGITFIVTPLNHLDIEPLFLETIDLDAIDTISIEFQNFIMEEEFEEYARVLKNEFNVNQVKYAAGLIRDTDEFAGMNFHAIAEQIQRLKEICNKRGISLICQPKTMTQENIMRFFSAQWNEMSDFKKTCPLPWIYAEVSASGEVTPCHTFYDLAGGNVHREDFLSIWNGSRMKEIRGRLQKSLFPICTACSRYYMDISQQFS